MHMAVGTGGVCREMGMVVCQTDGDVKDDPKSSSAWMMGRWMENGGGETHAKERWQGAGKEGKRA